ncbi:gamma-butyrobetaine dioxygenase isoform X2 [Canis lupus baileyi]|uniref:gamma-butyrobetaine dioxygenase isoform X2 n=1 Tax=Canis lupus familiaris TaxID=9615 RepID=UPI000BAA3735|nr:gamma-butyrobetaine dioxygenase isoform X2 [Canis lupus familiaris]|eukprot:XP_022263653.1 gamma-butyrobetaine dioxygenase isoform X2 [Canis lupus familiaris]
MHCAIQKAEVLDGAHLMQILWHDGAESLYPAVWLRDNCQCPDCYLDSAKARKLLVEALDVNIVIKGLTFDRRKVCITWPNEHCSEFEADWLKKRCFSQQAREKLQRELFLPECQYWGAELQLPTLNFEDVLKNDEHAYQWLSSLKKVGIVRLTGASDKRGQVLKLGKRIGFLYLTFYGHTWQVQDKIDANNVAYTTGKLSFHTDYPALHHPPGVRLDDKGQVIRINFNNATRDTVFDVPVQRVQPFYAALKEFVDLMNCKEFKFTFKMNPGDVITFDNWRLLHGRRSYEAGTEISRHLEGAYADWDVVMSRLRILRQGVQHRN